MFGFIPALVGSLFGNKKKREVTTTQTTRNEIDYVKLRQNAEAGGFNPLTALQNGGGAGHMVSHVPFTRMMGGGRNFIGKALDAFNQTASGVMSAIGMPVGGGGGGFAPAFDYDPLREEKAYLERDIMKAQLHRLNGGVSYNRSMGVPVSTGTRYKTNDKIMARGLPREPGKRTVTNPWPDGVSVSPKFVDVEALENRYGEGIITNVVGWGLNGAADARYNVLNRYLRRTHGGLAVHGGFSARYPSNLKRLHHKNHLDRINGKAGPGW